MGGVCGIQMWKGEVVDVFWDGNVWDRMESLGKEENPWKKFLSRLENPWEKPLWELRIWGNLGILGFGELGSLGFRDLRDCGFGHFRIWGFEDLGILGILGFGNLEN